MIFISRKKKIKIGKLIATTKFIVTHAIGETDKKTQIENMSKIIENLADIAFEIGGYGFAMFQIPYFENKLEKELEKRNEQE